MMKKIACIAIFISSVTFGTASAGPDYQVGTVVNYTTVEGGLLLLLDTGVPDNCAGTPFGWMVIDELDKAMLAMAFMRISQEQMGVTLYSNGSRYLGFCRVTQFDPAD